MRKARSIPLSPEHGVNPTIPVCFWCGKDKNEIALLGRIGGKEDREALSRMVLDYEPCEECSRGMSRGFRLDKSASGRGKEDVSLQKRKIMLDKWVWKWYPNRAV